jgi:mono/diheme cytochrome c family protein
MFDSDRFTYRLIRWSGPLAWPSLVWLVIVLVGCDARIDNFEPNSVYAKRLELSADVDLATPLDDVQIILNDLFGTPDDPKWPACLDSDARLGQLVAVDQLTRAAGAVRSDQQGTHFGLYREHCILCHGASGNGLGPTSRLLNPYPRDFRLGKFKFTSTPIGRKPTREDLSRILESGIVGTSMPSFRLLEEDDLGALVDYVIYLSIRGEVERRLLSMAAYELDVEAGERLVDQGAAEWSAYRKSIEEIVVSVARHWAEAEEYALDSIEPPSDLPLVGSQSDALDFSGQLQESIAHGREIFLGKVGNCASCHGIDATGDGLVTAFDEWTNDWTVGAGLDPRDKQQLRPMLKLGALKPRTILPRNLREGNYRGGSRPEDIYRRIVLGIEGSNMPAAPMKPDNPFGLTERDAWDLVNYLLSLAADRQPASKDPSDEQAGVIRDREGGHG